MSSASRLAIITPARDVKALPGQLVDFAKALPYYLPVNGRDESTLVSAEGKLAETHCRAGRSDVEVIWPRRVAVERLAAG